MKARKACDSCKRPFTGAHPLALLVLSIILLALLSGSAIKVYSALQIGLVYVFNLIVGTGALTMPKAFSTAGWLLSLLLIIALAVMSYMTVTFVIEAMAVANAVRMWKKRQSADTGVVEVHQEEIQAYINERTRLLPSEIVQSSIGHEYFEIRERMELGQMASMFFNKVGAKLFYLCMAVYLYGDLAIYAAAVPKSLRNVACTFDNRTNSTNKNETYLTENEPCWEAFPYISRMNAYRIFLGAFTVLLGPFVFFNVQKMKHLQVFTTIMRWLAFSMMVVLAVIYLAEGHGQGHPPIARFQGVPTLFGVCVYSFMCHHSLPSLVTPIRDKSKITGLFGADYFLILVFYCLLSFTGIYSFSNLQDLYTLNFEPSTFDRSDVPITNVAFIQYFLALFPVFTLSTNFPIIAITLRNNLKTLFLTEGKRYHFLLEGVFFPVVTLVPPIVIALITLRVDILVGITGSYAGAGIQYIIPAGLVWAGRREVMALMGQDYVNKHKSPFSHTAWVIFILIWAVISISIVTINHVLVGF